MEILSDVQHEVLSFVHVCNRSQYCPTAEEVTIWQLNQLPRPAEVRRVVTEQPSKTADTAATRLRDTMIGESLRPMMEAFSASISSSLASAFRAVGDASRYEVVRQAESTVEHLVRLTWLQRIRVPGREAAGLRLTDLGLALYREAEVVDREVEDVSVVVLGREDPLAYPMLIGLLSSARADLLVDPYAKLADLHTLVINTQITRLLISGKGSGGVRASMATYLDSSSLARTVEVRSSNELHDRVVIDQDGNAFTLGTSLNGVGRTTTVFTPMNEAASEALEEECERLWDEADLVGPTLGEDDEEEVEA